ncbi:MAG: Plug domain-containing protein [Croceitalea sp.]|nr:Plug domain-containing protein [Croceitalea sp.]
MTSPTSKSQLNYLVVFLFAMAMGNAQSSGPGAPAEVTYNETATFLTYQMNELDSLVAWQEQVVLHTNKTLLKPKEQLFFKAYVLTGPEQLRVSASEVLKVELLDENGSLIHSQYHKIHNGTSEGSFEIPKKSETGLYYLRAYTRWMLNYGPENFATKKLMITGRNKGMADFNTKIIKAEVFPEGGQLIAGLENRVVIEHNKTLQGTLEVIDQMGMAAAVVQDYGNGLGSFVFVPEKGNTYHVKLDRGQTMKLPEIENVGYTLRVNNLNHDRVVVHVAATPGLLNQDLYLRGKINGLTFFENKIVFDKNKVVEVVLPKMEMPKGSIILHLEDEFEQVWATRPLFIVNDELSISMQNQIINTNEKQLKIKVTDTNGTPIQTELSINVGQLQDNFDIKGPFIKTFENDRNQMFMNDLLVLTGKLPADYALNKTIALPDEIKYSFQNGLEFYGKAFDLNNSLLPNTKIQILITTKNDVIAKEAVTNTDGLFHLKELQIDGKAKIVFRMVAEDAKDKFVKVVPYEYETPPLMLTSNTPDKGTGLKSKQFLPQKQATKFNKDEGSEKLVMLKGVTLVGEKLKVKKSPSVYGIEPSRVAFQDSKSPKTIPELFLGIPGVWVKGLGDINPSLILPRSAGVGPVLWVVDGLPLAQTPAEMGSTQLGEIMSMIPYIDVDRIELLYGANAAIYGVRAAGGAILIYTRNGSDENFFNRKKAELTFSGYHESLSFDNDKKDDDNNKKAYQEAILTLYWNPGLKTDENGEIILNIPEVDVENKVFIDIKTIMPDGRSGTLKALLRP